jgi:hypothetical protein
MRLLLIFLVVTACSGGERHSEPGPSSKSETVVQTSSGAGESAQSQKVDRSSPSTNPETSTVVTDSSFVGLTPLSDSITHIGSGIIDETYGAFDYIKNGVEYASIVRDIGTKPNGQPLMGIVSTVVLPPMDTTEHLMFSGLCGTDYKSDQYVLAVVGIGGDSVYRNIKRAWRFDRQAKTLREIPTKNVVCFDPMGDP